MNSPQNSPCLEKSFQMILQCAALQNAKKAKQMQIQRRFLAPDLDMGRGGNRLRRATDGQNVYQNKTEYRGGNPLRTF